MMIEPAKIEDLPGYEYRGARASVLLHEQQMRLFLDSWRRAREAGATLPDVADPDYASCDALLVHVLRWSRRYLIWICEKLVLPEPGIGPEPGVDGVETEADNFLGQLLAAWRKPLRGVQMERFFNEVYSAPWGVTYCIDAMLDHAVTHPEKHRFQLEELMMRG